jgi:hypothetical protein
MKGCKHSLGALILLTVSSSASIFDAFSDGDDNGWTRLSPLDVVGAPGAFNFPNLGPGGIAYEIAAPVSPNPALYGPARAASLRLDEAYSTFFQQVDIVDWDETRTSMVMGFLARAGDFGLGTTDGYICILEANGDLSILTTANELPGAAIAENNAVNLDPNADYRLTFSGNGPLLSAALYNLNDLDNPLASIVGMDFTYSSGNSGLFVYDGSTAGNQTATAAFDNYASAIPEPASAGMLAAGLISIVARRRRSVA